jgi:HTH-type transcriptional regulator/antitoxin HigA
MAKIASLMAKGSKNVTKKELAQIRKLAAWAQGFEQNKHQIEAPSTLAGVIEMKMYQMKLKQKELARKLKISDTKLSLIMSGKQKPDVRFLKAVHQQLDVDADFLLNVV